MSLPLILKKNDGFYSIPILEEYRLKAVFTTRKYDMGFQQSLYGPRHLLRKQVYKKMGLRGARLVRPSQVHGDSVCVVNGQHKDRGAYHRSTVLQETDALITAERRLPLAILTADCLPIFLFDPNKRVIAMVHAGWRGVHKKIITKTVQKMSGSFKTSPSDLIVALGPALRTCCYEVGGEFRNLFPGAIYSRGKKLYFDIAAAATEQMLKCGIAAGHIYDSHICTSCLHSEFFSYRKEGLRAGRSMSVMELS